MDEMLWQKVILRIFSYITALFCDGVYNPFSLIGNGTPTEQYTFFP